MLDIKELYNISVTPYMESYKEYIERKETLYYDESGNDKHLIVKDGKLNAPYDAVFVLGGINAEDDISSDELKDYLGINRDKELKAKNDFKGTFTDVLRKKRVGNVLKLIDEKNWHIHFNAIQILYYGFVDIVDSINGLEHDNYEYKALLYNILKSNPEATVEHFKRYKYPNIKDADISAFLDGLIDFIDDSMNVEVEKSFVHLHKLMLKMCLENAKNQKALDFIQNEKPHEWVKAYFLFYRQEIVTFMHKTLIFDEEEQVQAELKDGLSYNGAQLNHYSFCDSETNVMIQLSDYVVGLLRKYFIFLDRTQSEVEANLNAFNETQMSNYKKLNKILKKSIEYNPLFINTTMSIYCRNKMLKYMSIYNE
jgi:hypothetical protein